MCRFSIKIGLLILFVLQTKAQVMYENQAETLGFSGFNCGNTYLGNGVSFRDFDNDGWDDISLATGDGVDLLFFKNNNGSIISQNFNLPVMDYQTKSINSVDIDNDGEMELITGHRYRAHNGNDPGDNNYPALYYFKWNGESFTKNVISYGPFGEGKGTGVFFTVADLHKTGRKDIIVAGKEGLAVFFNLGTD